MPTSRRKKPKFPVLTCKPCWELHYCPYGPLVEHFPLNPEQRSIASVKRQYKKILGMFASGQFKTEQEILAAIDWLEYHWPGRWEALAGYSLSDLHCKIFGHICPAFLTASGATETQEGRAVKRTIPRDILLKVVRRDGQICQECFRHVPDQDIELDHIIPHSKGGPTTVANLRLLHSKCNRRKRDSVAFLVD